MCAYTMLCASIKHRISRFYPVYCYLITFASWNANENSFYKCHLPLATAYTKGHVEAVLKKSSGIFSYIAEYETVLYLHVLLDCKYFAVFLLTTNCVQTMITVLLTYTMKGCKQLHYAKMHPKVLELATTNKNGN